MDFLNREIPSLHAAALILGAAALASKLLGLLRDRLLASRFGAGDTLDVYYAAFQIPDALFTLFLVGAASAAVLPVFLECERRSPKEAEDFISNLLTVFGVFAGAAAGGAMVFAGELMSWVAPGFDPAKLSQAVGLTRWMILGAIFLGASGIVSSVLQARHRFLVFALPPIVYNLGIIFGILALAPLAGAQGLAYGVLSGAVLQVLVQLPALRAMGFRFAPAFNLFETGLRQVVRVSLPRVLALGMSQFTLIALTAIASFFASGSISVFKLAANLVYVPVGLFGASWAMAVFPKLSSAFLEGRGQVFREEVSIGIRNILFWALPFAALFVVLRAHIVRVVLGSGVFDWEDTRLVAAVLAVLALAVVSESILPLILRAFYALGRTREPLLWDIVGSLVTVFLALGFSWFFVMRPEALKSISEMLRIGDLASPQILAVAMAFALGSLANVLLLGFALRRASARHIGAAVGFEGGALVSMAGAAVLAGLAAYGALLPFPALVATNTFLGIFLQGTAAGLAGFLVYGVALWWQRNPEILGLAESIRRRLVSVRRTPQVFETEKLDGDTGR